MPSKFHPVTVYQERQPDRPTYSLLPFRFERLDGESYVLTNLVGEFLVLDRGSLDDFVQKRIPMESSVYQDLSAKHFLRESEADVNVDLLALKFRTKQSRLCDFTALHMLVVTLRCEHSCPYCQVSRRSHDKTQFDMSEEVATKAIDLVFRSPSPTLKIEFQGGESLLNFPLIEFIVLEAEKRAAQLGRDLQFVIATNLAVVTDAMLEFCALHSILISTSLDGPRDLHNRNRPRPEGNSYEKVVEGIAKARRILGKDQVSALMTTTEASLSMAREIIDEYLALEFEGIFLRALSPYGYAIKTKTYNAYGVERWLDFYFEGLDYIIDLNRRGIPFKEYYACMILTKMLSPFPTGYVDLVSPAGIGIAAVVYNHDGRVYASDESRMLAEMGDQTFLLGHVLENSWEEIFTSDKLLDPLEASFAGSCPSCVDCAFEPYCGANPVFHHATQGDFIGHKPTSAFCARNMGIFKRLLSLYQKDEFTRTLFRRWGAL